MAEEKTVAEKQTALRHKRSGAEKEYRRFTGAGGTPAPGLGKGREPKPWCECHNRNPCPIDQELNK